LAGGATPFGCPLVAESLTACSVDVLDRLLALRALVFATARVTDGVPLDGLTFYIGAKLTSHRRRTRRDSESIS
jgi:hypothetical protein